MTGESIRPRHAAPLALGLAMKFASDLRIHSRISRIRVSRWGAACRGGLSWLVAAAALMGAAELSARDIHVNNLEGDDRNEGRMPVAGSGLSGPCRSIARGLFLAHAGDRLILAKTSEPYRESITLEGPRHSGVPTQPFRIVGNGAILDGRQEVRVGAWQPLGDDLYRFPAARRSLGMLYREDRPAYPRARPVSRSTPRTLRPGEGLLYDGWYYARLDAGRMPSQYPFSATALPVGITLYNVQGVIIEDLVVQGFQQDGVCAADGASDVRLVHLTARGNGRSGVAVCGASRVTVEMGLLANNGQAQAWIEGNVVAQFDLCTLPDGSAPALLRDGGRVVRDGKSL